MPTGVLGRMALSRGSIGSVLLYGLRTGCFRNCMHSKMRGEAVGCLHAFMPCWVRGAMYVSMRDDLMNACVYKTYIRMALGEGVC